MATIYNMAGTTSKTFTIGDGGITIFSGIGTPIDEMGNIGDIYVQKEIDNSDFGRIYHKEVFDGVAKWNFIKTYTFDDDIIHAIETSTNSNNFKIALESADNSGIVTSTKQNDYTNNHSAYGVTRFATNAESQSHVDKFISETPKQTYDNIIAITGLLSNLQTPNTSSLVASDNSLQAQIDTIVSKSDVVDLVGTYAELIAYDTHVLGDDDVIKVLQDETNSEATTYYRFTPVPTNPNVSVATKAALDAYPTTSLTIGNVAKVDADETHSGQEAYYVWRKLNGTPSWIYAGPDATSVPHTSGKYYWDRIGEEGPFYTKSEADGRFVNATDNVTETITGAKTFNTTPDVGTLQASDNSTKAASTAYVTSAISTEDNLVVHKTGNETITGNKDFTGATLTVKTQNANDNSTKAASTAYVDALIKVPPFTTTDNGKYLGVETNSTTQTTSLVWKSADNITLNNITDVTITSPTSGQVLIYDSTLNANAGGWKNGSQVTATIKYW